MTPMAMKPQARRRLVHPSRDSWAALACPSRSLAKLVDVHAHAGTLLGACCLSKASCERQCGCCKATFTCETLQMR
jgi:hypothetical protein